MVLSPENIQKQRMVLSITWNRLLVYALKDTLGKKALCSATEMCYFTTSALASEDTTETMKPGK